MNPAMNPLNQPPAGGNQGKAIAALRHRLRRLGIEWQMHRIDVIERKAATELAYERAHVMQTAQNFNALLVSNQQLRQIYQKQLQELGQVSNLPLPEDA